MKAYISSSYPDLETCRRSVYQALRKIRIDAIGMEDYVATDRLPLDRCLADVRLADLFLGIFAWRYGFIPEGRSLSITELEYRAARASGVPVLIFILRDGVAWPADRVDSDLSRIARFRSELEKEHVVSYFEGPDDLACLRKVAPNRR